MNSERLYSIILAPHVSEKSALIGELNNQYTFKVANDATKPEIKAAVEELFSANRLHTKLGSSAYHSETPDHVTDALVLVEFLSISYSERV